MTKPLSRRMSRNVSIILTLCFTMLSVGVALAAEPEERTQVFAVYYEQGSYEITYKMPGNRAALHDLDSLLYRIASDATMSLVRVNITSSVSPEGTVDQNNRLAAGRNSNLRDRILRYHPEVDGFVGSIAVYNDWENIYQSVLASHLPEKDDIIDIIENIPEYRLNGSYQITSVRLKTLMSHNGGRTWEHIQKEIFPKLRRSLVTVVYTVDPDAVQPGVKTIIQRDTVYIFRDRPVAGNYPDAMQAQSSREESAQRDNSAWNVGEPVPVPVQDAPVAPLYVSSYRPSFAIRLNAAYLAALVPNLGVEFRFGNGWAVGGTYVHAWWKNVEQNRFWQTYGGEVNARKYFGTRRSDNPFSGHHVGAYGQMITYDFELGGLGYQAPKPNWGGGIDYGYTLPLGKHWGLDFSVGVGVLAGEYKLYEPIGGHYVWKETRNRIWFGPTKVEITIFYQILSRKRVR